MGDETFLRLVEEGADWVLERGGGGDHDLEIAESFQKIEARQKRRSENVKCFPVLVLLQ